MRGWSGLNGASIASLLALGAAFLLPPEALPSLPACWMKNLFGVPCPACGLTRGFLAIGHGRFAEAWAFNPFSFALYIQAVCLVVTAWGPFKTTALQKKFSTGSFVALEICVLCGVWAFHFFYNVMKFLLTS